MERAALASESTEFKLMSLVVPLVLALDILVITSDPRQGRVACILAIPLALLTGHRTYVLFAFLVAVFRMRPKIGGWKLITMASLCGLVVFAGKTVYGVAHMWWQGGQISLELVYENLQTSLSGLDAYASYVIAVFYTQEPSPLWYGRSYAEIPLLLTWPRFLGGFDVSTLAETYVWRYHTGFARDGGGLAFSAIAEAWLNFGYLGSVLLGFFWGGITRFFDNRPRGVAFYIVLFIVVRLFRSDFATLYKNWALGWGALFVVVLSLLVVYTLVAHCRAGSMDADFGDGPARRPGTRGSNILGLPANTGTRTI